MLKNQKIAVVVPAFNEEKLILRTITRIPDFVDCIIVVDDCSDDQTVNIIKNNHYSRVHLISHTQNRGVGAAITTGYEYSLQEQYDLIAVMAGDDQMDPDDLKPMVLFMIKHHLDYIKGNRFKRKETITQMPFMRMIGSLGLSVMTKVATGFYHIGDPQSGYTVITQEILKKIPLKQLFPRYGYPNDLLGKLAIVNALVGDFPIAAIYKGEESGIKPLKMILPYSRLLLRIWLDRIKKQYVKKGL